MPPQTSTSAQSGELGKSTGNRLRRARPPPQSRRSKRDQLGETEPARERAYFLPTPPRSPDHTSLAEAVLGERKGSVSSAGSEDTHTTSSSGDIRSCRSPGAKAARLLGVEPRTLPGSGKAARLLGLANAHGLVQESPELCTGGTLTWIDPERDGTSLGRLLPWMRDDSSPLLDDKATLERTGASSNRLGLAISSPLESDVSVFRQHFSDSLSLGSLSPLEAPSPLPRQRSLRFPPQASSLATVSAHLRVNGHLSALTPSPSMPELRAYAHAQAADSPSSATRPHIPSALQHMKPATPQCEPLRKRISYGSSYHGSLESEDDLTGEGVESLSLWSTPIVLDEATSQRISVDTRSWPISPSSSSLRLSASSHAGLVSGPPREDSRQVSVANDGADASQPSPVPFLKTVARVTATDADLYPMPSPKNSRGARQRTKHPRTAKSPPPQTELPAPPGILRPATSSEARLHDVASPIAGLDTTTARAQPPPRPRRRRSVASAVSGVSSASSGYKRTQRGATLGALEGRRRAVTPSSAATEAQPRSFMDWSDSDSADDEAKAPEDGSVDVTYDSRKQRSDSCDSAASSATMSTVGGRTALRHGRRVSQLIDPSLRAFPAPPPSSPLEILSPGAPHVSAAAERRSAQRDDAQQDDGRRSPHTSHAADASFLDC